MPLVLNGSAEEKIAGIEREEETEVGEGVLKRGREEEGMDLWVTSLKDERNELMDENESLLVGKKEKKEIIGVY